MVPLARPTVKARARRAPILRDAACRRLLRMRASRFSFRSKRHPETRFSFRSKRHLGMRFAFRSRPHPEEGAAAPVSKGEAGLRRAHALQEAARG